MDFRNAKHTKDGDTGRYAQLEYASNSAPACFLETSILQGKYGQPYKETNSYDGACEALHNMNSTPTI